MITQSVFVRKPKGVTEMWLLFIGRMGNFYVEKSRYWLSGGEKSDKIEK